MSDEKTKNKNRNLDEDGVRLAPAPIKHSDYHVLPSIRQEFVLEPSLHIDEPKDAHTSDVSTEDDFQPKIKDRSKRWKRQKRGKNIIFGAIMLVFTLLVVLAYVLAAAGQNLSLPIKYVPENLNVVGKLVYTFQMSADFEWTGPVVKAVWLEAVPSLVLLVGILFLLFNLIKSICALFGAVKPVRYLANSIIYLVCVLTVLVFNLIGVKAFGIEQIDFVNDFIKAYATSELFSLVVFAVINVIASAVCTLANKDKLGYIR